VRIAAAVLILLTSSALADEVTLQTPTGALYGTLLTPSSTTPAPVVLIIAGSGAIDRDRDGNATGLPGPNNSLRMLAEGLEARGIASLRYDKRGVGASSGALLRASDLTFDIAIDYAMRWLQQLRSDPRFSLVSVAGHSEGSLIGIIVAERIPVDRVISIDGTGRRAGDLILSQLEGLYSPDVVASARSIVAALNAGTLVPNVPPELNFLFRPSAQPYLISWFRYDLVVEIGRLQVPTLVIHGTTDTEVPLSDAFLLAGGNRLAVLRLIPGMNHVLKDVPVDDDDAQNRSYYDPTLPIDAALVAAIGDFINPPIRRRVVR
jgi:pimeloyl-ACP methyl ester carboxylesterase